jgi:hypothetical protein
MSLNAVDFGECAAPRGNIVKQQPWSKWRTHQKSECFSKKSQDCGIFSERPHRTVTVYICGSWGGRGSRRLEGPQKCWAESGPTHTILMSLTVNRWWHTPTWYSKANRLMEYNCDRTNLMLYRCAQRNYLRGTHMYSSCKRCCNWYLPATKENVYVKRDSISVIIW